MCTLDIERLPLIDAFDDFFLKHSKRPNIANSVPRVLLAWFALYGFVAFQETRHEQFFGERCKFDASPFAVADILGSVLRIDDAKHRAWLWRVIRRAPFIFGLERTAAREAHQRVAIRRHELSLVVE